jgi:hypothetical protein
MPNWKSSLSTNEAELSASEGRAVAPALESGAKSPPCPASRTKLGIAGTAPIVLALAAFVFTALAFAQANGALAATVSGQLGLAYEFVRERDLNEEADFSSDTRLSINQNIQNGALWFDLQGRRSRAFESGPSNFTAMTGLRKSGWEFLLNGQLSQNRDIIDSLRYKGRDGNIRVSLGYNGWASVPVRIEFSRSDRKSRRDTLTTYEFLSDELKLSVSRVGKTVESGITARYSKSQDKLAAVDTRFTGSDMYLGAKLRDRFQARLSFSPSENVLDSDSNKTTSMKGGLLLSAQVYPYLVISAEGSQEDVTGKTMGVNFDRSVLLQRYGLSAKSGLRLGYRAFYETNRTEGQQESKKVEGELRYEPGYYAGRSSGVGGQPGSASASGVSPVGGSPPGTRPGEDGISIVSSRIFYQRLRIENASGGLLSQSDVAEVASGIKFGAGRTFEERWTYSTSKYGTPGTERTHEHRAILNWKHAVARSFKYELRADGLFREFPGGDEQNISAGPRFEFTWNVGGRPWSAAVGYDFGLNDVGGLETRTQDERLVLSASFVKGFFLNYSLALRQLDGHVASDTTKTTLVRNDVTLSFQPVGSLFRVAASYGNIDSDQGKLQTLGANLSVPVVARLTLDATYNQEILEDAPGEDPLIVRAGLGYHF